MILISVNTGLYAETLKQRDLLQEGYFGDVPNMLIVSRLSQVNATATVVNIIDRETTRVSDIVHLPEIFRLREIRYLGKSGHFNLDARLFNG